MSNKDLLKQAIAEAKTIREAAIANAKEALEETLTPHLKEMLAQKLQEMEEGAEMDEYGMEHNDRDLDGDGKVDANDTRLAEAEEEEEEAEEGEEGAEEEGNEEEEELEIEDMSVEDLKDLIRDIVAQETGNEEAETETGEEAPEGDDLTSVDDSEEIDINELLAELEGMDETHGYTAKPGSVSKGTSEPYGAKRQADKGANDGLNTQSKRQPSNSKHGNTYQAGAGHKPGRETYTNEQEVEEGFEDWIGRTGEKLDAFGKKSKVVKAINKATDAAVAAGQKVFPSTGWNKGAHIDTGSSKNEELNEALQAVKILRNQLQEVNLLNAKLLYVNKVFKSNNLSEGQKVNVIAAFDKAETVKEVKLVFETVSKNVVAKPAAIKEHRSFASKATGNAQTTAPKEILSEVSEQVARWQKLAGIIKS